MSTNKRPPPGAHSLFYSLPNSPPMSPTDRMHKSGDKKSLGGILKSKGKSPRDGRGEEFFQVFTIPRVEVRCRDPTCPYNSQEHSSPGSDTSSCHATPWHSTELASRSHYSKPKTLANGSNRSKSGDTRTTTMTSNSSGSSARYASVLDPVGPLALKPSRQGSRPLPPSSIVLNPAMKRLPPLPDEFNTSKHTSVQTSPTTRFGSREKCAACQYSPLAQFPNCSCRYNTSKLADMDMVNPFWRFENRHNYLSGGFTLNGPHERRRSGGRLKRFCSSHKIALVVSTFSLLVTVGLVVTLLFMKNKGMMEPM